jgi:soluble lytic murein transglycosylase-like protein
MEALAAAIIWLVPQIPQHRAESYAELIAEHSAKHEIDPLLVTAITYRESRFAPHTASKGNYGLMQVRVTPKRRPRWVGREREVMEPVRNIRMGVAELAMWRSYHRRECGVRNPHPWWSHYQHGGRVRNLRSAVRIGRVYSALKARFRTEGVPQS